MIRVLIYIYEEQEGCVKLIGVKSTTFKLTNGTRQGAVFSPRGGFITYLDVLIRELRNSGQGAQLGLHWFGGLFWADDGILLSTSVQGLQVLVDVCQSHAAATDLMFSTDPEKPCVSRSTVT